ncbi:MAG: PucR family transcriptional regulator [Caulobacteraceae bacterium]
MEPLRTSRLKAGKAGADNLIMKLNIMADYEIVDWVGEGELLLTTTLSLSSEPNLMESLIEKLWRKSLAGIAVKTAGGKPIEKRLIEQADKLGFPLIELDPEIAFTDITNTISSHIFNKQAAIIVKLEKTHKNLTNIVLNGGSLKDIAKTIYSMTKNPVVIRDNIFGGCEGEDGMEENGLLNNYLLPVAYREERLDSIFDRYTGKSFESTDNINGKPVTRLNVPILACNNIYGYILLWDINKPMKTLDIRILETASTVVALEIVKRMSVYQVVSRYKMEFLENLLSRDLTMQNMAFDKGHFFGLEDGYGYSVLVVNAQGNELKKDQEMTAKDIFNRYKNSIIQEVEGVIKSSGNKYIIGEKSDSIVILLQAEPDIGINETKPQAEDIGNKIVSVVDSKYYKARITVGIGRYYKELRDLWKSYNEARKALVLGAFCTRNRVMHFENLGVYKLLCNENMENELLEFYKSTIYSLIEYDRRKKADFIPTLRAYFDTNGNLKKMADMLYIHYNTVLYRLQRLQQVAKIDLKSPDDRLNMEIALKIMNILEGQIVKDL